MKWTIQFKMVVLFAVIIFVGFAALLLAFNKVSVDNMYREIDKDMIYYKKNLDIAISQYFILLNKQMNEQTIEAEINEIEKQIGLTIGGEVDLYRADASSYKYAEGKSQPVKIFREVAEVASNSTIAYSTTINKNHITASLATPLIRGDQVIGIIRFEKDYSELFIQRMQFSNTITVFAIVIFVCVFIASIFISQRMTKPIRILIQHSRNVTNGSLDSEIEVHSHDEIGELAKSFSKMIRQIREQIDVIEHERDEVKLVQERSKIFFDNVTHELKTPLTTILGYAQILRDNGFTDHAFFEKGLNYVINESRRLNRMVVNILDASVAASTRRNFQFESMNISNVLKETCDEMSIKADKYNIMIDTGIESNLLLYGDINRLKEVFINVLDNSIKYSYVNSTITVNAFKSGDEIKIMICDQGEGIQEEELERIFEPFYRDNDVNLVEKGSAGLGLSIVKNTIEQHGGKVRMKSIINLGSELQITLPVNSV
ncbi:sensor histidine kinase [Paenibacillus donghaensis]|uniref:histidine kinase n=1 Tax=Paenibacillus donghaensis TaxID=414771 RepID=A0A2Z2KG62_9BACL|nr:HAMP domain-containing sensor histidine kinase [Paenibacillus donghaensis]ASA19802.1 two-component sensor histidine kinase [Paenibacillus donghaensis]